MAPPRKHLVTLLGVMTTSLRNTELEGQQRCYSSSATLHLFAGCAELMCRIDGRLANYGKEDFGEYTCFSCPIMSIYFTLSC